MRGAGGGSLLLLGRRSLTTPTWGLLGADPRGARRSPFQWELPLRTCLHVAPACVRAVGHHRAALVLRAKPSQGPAERHLEKLDLDPVLTAGPGDRPPRSPLCHQEQLSGSLHSARTRSLRGSLLRSEIAENSWASEPQAPRDKPQGLGWLCSASSPLLWSSSACWVLWSQALAQAQSFSPSALAGSGLRLQPSASLASPASPGHLLRPPGAAHGGLWVAREIRPTLAAC